MIFWPRRSRPCGRRGPFYTLLVVRERESSCLFRACRWNPRANLLVLGYSTKQCTAQGEKTGNYHMEDLCGIICDGDGNMNFTTVLLVPTVSEYFDLFGDVSENVRKRKICVLLRKAVRHWAPKMAKGPRTLNSRWFIMCCIFSGLSKYGYCCIPGMPYCFYKSSSLFDETRILRSSVQQQIPSIPLKQNNVWNTKCIFYSRHRWENGY